MSLSVERLRELRGLLYPIKPDSQAYLIIRDKVGRIADGEANDIDIALRELIAIKEEKPVAYGMPNTAITGMPHALMQVAIDVPSNDQYGGALWLPLIRKPE